MSNHWHAVISDPKGRLPQFTGWLHKYVAKCINASLGRWENLWASEPPSYVRLESDEDVMDKIVYCLTNPVAAGLVPQGSQWGGVCTTTDDLFGCSQTVTRPRVFFREKGKMRATATLTITPPTLHNGESLESFVQSTREAVAASEAKIQQRFANKEWEFLGMERVLAQRTTDSPRTSEPRRGLSPRVGAKDKWRRIEGLMRNKKFGNWYKDAHKQFRTRVRDVRFPPGTYAMRLIAGVLCATSWDEWPGGT